MLPPLALIARVCEHEDVALNGDVGIGFAASAEQVDRMLLELTREASAEAADPGPFSSLRLDLIGQRLAIRLLLTYSTMAAAFATGPAVAPRGGLSQSRLRRALDLLDGLGEEQLSLPVLAAAAGCSPTHFSRTFKQSTGMAPFAWLLHRRVERAKEMLGPGRPPIAEVALAVGFAGQSPFTIAFRRVTGTTPAAWRRSIN